MTDKRTTLDEAVAEIESGQGTCFQQEALMYRAGAEPPVEICGIDDVYGHAGGLCLGADPFGGLRRGVEVEQLALPGDQSFAHRMRAVERDKIAVRLAEGLRVALGSPVAPVAAWLAGSSAAVGSARLLPPLVARPAPVPPHVRFPLTSPCLTRRHDAQRPRPLGH